MSSLWEGGCRGAEEQLSITVTVLYSSTQSVGGSNTQIFVLLWQHNVKSLNSNWIKCKAKHTHTSSILSALTGLYHMLISITVILSAVQLFHKFKIFSVTMWKMSSQPHSWRCQLHIHCKLLVFLIRVWWSLFDQRQKWNVTLADPITVTYN